ncbi:hypothetical protein LTR86_009769 [Recurvomyces mirabilis]|nr:hypothetical protein LTR86_009769 [Recurvomyces mirabilis]
MLARYEKQPFGVEHLETVAETTREFEQYLDDVRGVNMFERADDYNGKRASPSAGRKFGREYYGAAEGAEDVDAN